MNPLVTPELFTQSWWEVFLAGACTLGIYSFLIKENVVYRLFEHLFIGVAGAIGIAVTTQTFLWPQVFKPLIGYDRTPFPDGTYQAPYQSSLLLYLIPMGFGLLYYFILSPKRAWLAQLVIGFSLGVSGGLAFQGTLNELVPQITDSFRPLWGRDVLDNPFLYVSNGVFLFTFFCSMTYFFFTFKRKQGGVAEKAARSGRWLMMGCFGAFFGATIMARMALLVERVNFMTESYLPVLAQLFS